MKRLKIIVGGHFNAGKTTFVKTATEIQTFFTEKTVKNPEERVYKETTTTAMDFGMLNLEDKELHIFGLPGQERFSFMWTMLSKGANGFIFLIDSTTEELWRDTLNQIEIMTKNRNVPYLLCANKQDLPEAKPLSYIRKKLNVSENIPVLPCVAIDKATVLEILNILINKIEESETVRRLS